MVWIYNNPLCYHKILKLSEIIKIVHKLQGNTEDHLNVALFLDL